MKWVVTVNEMYGYSGAQSRCCFLLCAYYRERSHNSDHLIIIGGMSFSRSKKTSMIFGVQAISIFEAHLTNRH